MVSVERSCADMGMTGKSWGHGGMMLLKNKLKDLLLVRHCFGQGGCERIWGNIQVPELVHGMVHEGGTQPEEHRRRGNHLGVSFGVSETRHTLHT